jgi:IrrE N-terminal-like domain
LSPVPEEHKRVIDSRARLYVEPRAHELRGRYIATFGGDEIPVPVEAIAEDLLGLRIERSSAIDWSGMLLPAKRKILLNAAEIAGDLTPLRRFRFTIAHELGHWICHAVGLSAPQPVFCRSRDLSEDADRALEREANVFAAELLMPEPAVRSVWAETGGLEACAARFDVSLSAMHWRLYSFALLETSPD